MTSDPLVLTDDHGSTTDIVIISLEAEPASPGSFASKNAYYNWEGNLIRPQTDPGTGRREIGELSLFSSHGPTVDQRIKPDIRAPGEWVVGAFSQALDFEWHGSQVVVWPNPSVDWRGIYGAMPGTSMASSTVAEIVALILEANPRLTTDFLRIGARRVYSGGERRRSGIPGEDRRSIACGPYGQGHDLVAGTEFLPPQLQNEISCVHLH